MTEQEMTLICSAVAYMEACITISESSYKSFRCPNLRELKPCAPGRVAITVIDNPYLVSFFIPISVAYPKGTIILELAGNPLLPWTVVDNLRQHCRHACRFPRRNTCILEARDYMHKELVSTCAGKSVIKPLKGYVLVVSSKYVSEREMNALCAQAVSMQICIVITESKFKSLRCPHLKELRPCKPGQPAISIVNNLYFTTLTIPRMIVFPPGALIFEVAGNPHLSSEIIKILLTICPNCHITSNLGTFAF
ncbi:hypothetical protein OESDEN_06682 [Oesophagostomum dentatum]|uniref:Uncharacterized protein n=1 Tax=Oesophagostomum dentatum TaxID=61180 RepID=A0A0B1TDG4_OESDE|nr:hypothetical protein OESDEN_06682 [Oesophagostomum dentatum]